MNIMLVDNTDAELDKLKSMIEKVSDTDNIVCFTDLEKAVKYSEKHQLDVLFTEIQLREMTGFGLLEKVRKKHPQVYSIFMSHTEQYALNACRVHVQAYMLKPLKFQEIENEFIYMKKMQYN